MIIISCSNSIEDEEISSTEATPSTEIEDEEISSTEATPSIEIEDEDYSYVDWWPVNSESPGKNYKTSTSTIEIKKIPFPKKIR